MDGKSDRPIPPFTHEVVLDVAVELDIFSGRPNPIWIAVGPQAREIATLMQRLEPMMETMREPPGLGYRGFLITIGDTHAAVFGGAITVTRDGESQVFRDIGIEPLLLRQAECLGYGSLRPE
jgi:hypothetical protein